jgi:hypothetical protein
MRPDFAARAVGIFPLNVERSRDSPLGDIRHHELGDPMPYRCQPVVRGSLMPMRRRFIELRSAAYASLYRLGAGSLET